MKQLPRKMSIECKKQLAIKKEMLEEINDINYDLLNPVDMAWISNSSPMSVDECEDAFLGKTDLYEEWGNKSWNIINYIKLWGPRKYISEWDR